MKPDQVFNLFFLVVVIWSVYSVADFFNVVKTVKECTSYTTDDELLIGFDRLTVLSKSHPKCDLVEYAHCVVALRIAKDAEGERKLNQSVTSDMLKAATQSWFKFPKTLFRQPKRKKDQRKLGE